MALRPAAKVEVDANNSLGAADGSVSPTPPPAHGHRPSPIASSVFTHSHHHVCLAGGPAGPGRGHLARRCEAPRRPAPALDRRLPVLHPQHARISGVRGGEPRSPAGSGDGGAAAGGPGLDRVQRRGAHLRLRRLPHRHAGGRPPPRSLGSSTPHPTLPPHPPSPRRSWSSAARAACCSRASSRSTSTSAPASGSRASPSPTLPSSPTA